MKIKVTYEPGLSVEDTDGGCCLVSVEVSIDPNIPMRMQKLRIFHEILEATIGYAVNHDNLDRISADLLEGLEQLEGLQEEGL